ncbi:MAG: aminotransferase class I/II-fold pyridoxal phosphate-dependent enzyme [Planctomycetes bacterium]|nr:aminotransferase class I/II-fold pyridoxal phosphate-dependent enzyme [Planctomycetota bacterium]
MKEALMRLSTRAVHGVHPQPSVTEPIAPPISVASVYAHPDLDVLEAVAAGRRPAWHYRRYGHPNGRLLEETVAALEGGEDALACASGQSASLVLFWSALAKGDHVVSAQEIYGGTYSLLDRQGPRLGIEVSFVPCEPEAIERALRPNTRAIFFETITNPLIRVPDAKRIIGIAKKAGAAVFVDNTFATPVLARPLLWGADVVLHSGTKFLGGHGDAMSGLLVGKREFVRRARKLAVSLGAAVSPFDAWLTLRGVRTLSLRVRRASANAHRLAAFLSRKVRVHYPGLPRDPSHQVAEDLLNGAYGAMLSFDLGGWAAAKRFVKACRLVRLVPSLGDVATTMTHPARCSHAYLTPEERRRVGVGEGLIRVSTGVEDIEDILEEFRRAL